MKNTTSSADERLIEAARERARAEHTTLNEQFQLWLADYARSEQQAERAAGGEGDGGDAGVTGKGS